MRIVLFYPALLPPQDYGGIERMVLWLAKGLHELGHAVWVAAFPISHLPPGVQLISVEKKHSSPGNLISKLPRGVDLVHFMAPPGQEVLDQLPCGAILTVHGNGKPGEVFPKNSVFLSQSHAQRHGGSCFVYNGIDPAEYPFYLEAKDQKEEFLFLSKTSWKVKNLKGAMRLCARAQVPLAIAGGNRPLWERFRVGIHPQMRWLGKVNGEEKARLLAQAKALVFPVTWDEPFGLVVVEALMSGTPVLASRRGSLMEIVSPQVGAVLDDEEDWLRWLRRSSLPWAPEQCRAWALEKFHYHKMAQGYLEAYRRVMGGTLLHQHCPVSPYPIK